MSYNNKTQLNFGESSPSPVDDSTLDPEIIMSFQAMYPKHNLLKEFCDFYVECEDDFDSELEGFFFFIQNVLKP